MILMKDLCLLAMRPICLSLCCNCQCILTILSHLCLCDAGELVLIVDSFCLLALCRTKFLSFGRLIILPLLVLACGGAVPVKSVLERIFPEYTGEFHKITTNTGAKFW